MTRGQEAEIILNLGPVLFRGFGHFTLLLLSLDPNLFLTKREEAKDLRLSFPLLSLVTRGQQAKSQQTLGPHSFHSLGL